MAALSDIFEAGLLNHIFRGASAPTVDATNVWVALYTAAPSDSGGGTEVSTSGTNYARKAVARNVDTNWDAPASRATQNAGAITFNTPSGAWGTVTHFAIHRHATNDEPIVHGALTAQKTIGGTDPAPSFAAGALDIALTGAWSTYLADSILNWLFRNGSLATFGTHIYASLHTGDPGTTGASEKAVAGNYARVGCTRTPGAANGWGVGGANAAVTTGGALSNIEVITYGAPSADWGTLTDAGLWDADAAGNFLFSATMVDKTVNNGDTAPYFANNAFTITLA